MGTLQATDREADRAEWGGGIDPGGTVLINRKQRGVSQLENRRMKDVSKYFVFY